MRILNYLYRFQLPYPVAVFMEWWRGQMFHVNRTCPQIDINFDLTPEDLIMGLPEATAMVDLIFDKSCALHKHLTVPMQAEFRVDQFVRLQLDIMFPFHRERIYEGFTTIERNLDDRLLEIDVVAMEKTVVDHWISTLAQRNIRVGQIRVTKDCKLQPRWRHDDPFGSRIRLSKGALRLVILMLALMLPTAILHFQDRIIASLEHEITETRQLAHQTTALESKIFAHLDLLALMNRHLKYPSMISIMRSIDKALPEDFWVKDLQITHDTIVILGKRPGDTDLVTLKMDTAL